MNRGLNEAEEPILYGSLGKSILADRRARVKALSWEP